MKMEKTPRYTQRERNMVLGFAAQYKDVIENKRTDAESNRKKDEVWRQIAKEFNCRVYHQRSSKQLRQLYKNMKLLLKKDLCGGVGIGAGSTTGNASAESKSNRSFMDILNALSQQDSVAQYIAEQMSPSGYSSSRQQKFDDDFDESKIPSVAYDGLDNDVIVIKSEDISDNEHSSQNGIDMDDDDDDDCLSPKDIPEVCLEEEDDEIFATDLRQPATAHQQQPQSIQEQLQTAQQQPQTTQPQLQPEVTIQNVGGIRVGSIGSIANLANVAKSLLNGSNNNSTATNPTNTSTNNNSALNITLSTPTTSNKRNNMSTEQQQREHQQHLLFNGLGLSAVQTADQLPTLQHATQRTNNSNNNHHNGILALSSNSNYQHHHHQQQQQHKSSSSHNNHNHHNNHKNNHNVNSNNDYLMSLAIEERKRKIDLLNAQIEYWKTLTKKLDSNNGHNPTPSCLCHFPPAKMNGLQTQQSSS